MKNRFLIIFISIFLAAVLILGCVLGLVAILRSAKAVVKYDNVTMDAGCVRYFASYYKMIYIRTLRSSGVMASDTEAFWEKTDSEGVSEGEKFKKSFDEYIASLIAAESVFTENGSYTAEDKLTVTLTAEEILEDRAEGSVSKFNAAAKKYGFDYDDFCNALAILYKSQRAQEIVYGVDGENLSAFPDQCKKYLDTYSHVSLIFIRTEDILVKDDKGDFVYDALGNPVTRKLTEEEREEREASIETLTAAIDAKNSGGDKQITPEMFEIYLKKSDGDPEMTDRGYYFNPNASATVEFSGEFPEVVEAALEMEKYEYRRVDCSIGVCFIYKYDVTSDAYTDKEDLFFSDFYKDASAYLFTEVLETIIPEVGFTDAYKEIDVLSIPLIEEFYVKTWKK